MIKGSKGQSMIEAAFSLALVMVAFMAVCAFLHLKYLIFIGNYLAYEYLVCEETKNQVACADDYNLLFKKLVFLATVKPMKVVKIKNYSLVSTSIRSNYLFFSVTLPIHKKLTLPFEFL
jgi:hypothetical protein